MQPAEDGAGGGRARGTPSASAAASVSQDASDLTHGNQWWLPQPRPSLDPAHSEWRPAVPLLGALSCCVCSDLLKEAVTSTECGHSFCYDCIDAAVTIGGKANFCPVCGVLLGPNPWEHNRLKYDFTLDSLARKIFPRPGLDAALEVRRQEREEATRQAKADLARRPGRGFARSTSSGQLAGAGPGRAPAAAPAAAGDGAVELALFPLPGPGDAALQPLPRPYVRAPGGATVGAIKAWLVDRLVGKRAESTRLSGLALRCAGRELDAASTLREVRDGVWRPHCAGPGAPDDGGKGRVVLLEYSAL